MNYMQPLPRVLCIFHAAIRSFFLNEREARVTGDEREVRGTMGRRKKSHISSFHLPFLPCQPTLPQRIERRLSTRQNYMIIILTFSLKVKI